MSGRSRWCAALLAGALLAGCATAPPPPPGPPREPAPPADVPPAPEPSPAPEVPPAPPVYITVAAVGDMMLGTDYPENILPDDDGVSFLAEVAPVLEAADIAFGNLEGVLLDGGTPAKECKNPRACYLFRSPSRYVRYFAEAGFDVLSLANNHARDFGEEGRTATMRTLDAAGILHSGREGDFASLEVEGLDVAVLAFAVTKNSNMLLDYDLAAATVAEHAASHDIVIVSFHGGAEGPDRLHVPFAEEEYFDEPRGDVVYFARRMVDAGADLVLGHGPHVVRAMERYKDRLIAYSLGNFATYYGISVDGLAGIAPILVVTLDGEGRFVDGIIHSTEQIRPAGPSLDPSGKALAWIRDLSHEDFVTPGIRFEPDGRILPEERPTFVEHRPAAALAEPADDAAPLPRVGLDHVIVAVNDLEAAARSYRDLGFALKPGRPHANGIENRHVKFPDGIEIELLTAPAARDELTADYRRLLAEGDGPAYFALYAADPEAAARRLSAAGLAHTRQGGLITFPDEQPLCALFFSGRNHSPTDRPEHFAHPNTAETLIALWLAGDLAAEKELLALFGGTSRHETVRVPAPVRAEVIAIEDALVYLLPASHQLRPGRKIVGVTVRVRSLESARAALAPAHRGVVIEAERSLFVPPSATHGIWIELREEGRPEPE